MDIYTPSTAPDLAAQFARSVGQSYDPVNDPKIYTDPEKISQLNPEQQFEATVNLAATGRMGEVSLQEAELIRAGYAVSFDGNLSAEEAASYKKLEEQRNDKFLLDAGKDLIQQGAEQGLAAVIGTARFELGLSGSLSNAFAQAAQPAPAAPDSVPTLDKSLSDTLSGLTLLNGGNGISTSLQGGFKP